MGLLMERLMSAIDFSRCSNGQLLRVVGFKSNIKCSYRRMLLAMGIVPKTKIKFLRRSPFGDPLVFAVRGSQLCLRQDELEALHLECISE
jgi:Fe2+ transport system protein FeoA